MMLRKMNSDETSKLQRLTRIDKHIGSRIKQLRNSLKMSQQQLGALLGVTYQQTQKYECGENRISAGSLFEISLALGVSPVWFFEGFMG